MSINRIFLLCLSLLFMSGCTLLVTDAGKETRLFEGDVRSIGTGEILFHFQVNLDSVPEPYSFTYSIRLKDLPDGAPVN